MHRLVYDAEEVVDHINDNKLDNRRDNLRPCSHAYNIGRCYDRKDSSRNAIGHRGIVKTRNGTYCAYIDVNGKRKYKNHKTLESAVQQRIAWEIEVYGTDSPSLRRQKQKEDAMKHNIVINPDSEFVQNLRRRIKSNSGFCPCKLEKKPENKCPCRDFREGRGCDCG